MLACTAGDKAHLIAVGKSKGEHCVFHRSGALLHGGLAYSSWPIHNHEKQISGHDTEKNRNVWIANRTIRPV